MSKIKRIAYSLISVALLVPAAGLGQGEIQFRVRQQPGWDPQSSQGRCEVRFWVDHQAELRMRGDQIFVRTLEGARSYDEGSGCSQPIPYSAVRDFRLRQIAGRNGVTVAQEPNRMNNYTALILINDDQGGGDHYAFEVNWRTERDRPNIPAPFFDDVRACQDAVRQRFLSRNGRGAYIDFDGPADRQNQNQGREFIRGHGSAKNWNEARDLTYSCAVDARSSQVRSADYQYMGPGLRGNGRNRLK